MTNIQIAVYLLIAILLGGTLYAWYQFTVVYREHKCGANDCENPWTSKCFVGAVFFTLALMVALYIATFLL